MDAFLWIDRVFVESDGWVSATNNDSSSVAVWKHIQDTMDISMRKCNLVSGHTRHRCGYKASVETSLPKLLDVYAYLLQYNNTVSGSIQEQGETFYVFYWTRQ